MQNSTEQSSIYNDLSDKSTVTTQSHSAPSTARDPDLSQNDSTTGSQVLEPVINITPEYDNSQDVTPATDVEIHQQDITGEALSITMTQRVTSDVMIPVSINMSTLQDSSSIRQTDLQIDTGVPTFNGDSLPTSQDVTNNSSAMMLQEVTVNTVTHTYSSSDTYTSTDVTTCKGKDGNQISSQEVTNHSSSTTTLQDITMNIDPALINEMDVTGHTNATAQKHQLDITHGPGVPTWTNIVNIPSPGGDSSDNTIDIGSNLDNTNNPVGSSTDASISVKHQTSLSEHNVLHSESLRIKELCKSLGLPESVYTRYSDSYYPVLTPDESDINYINFKDIISKSWSVPLDYLSVEDIELEQSFLKCFKTSSPKT